MRHKIALIMIAIICIISLSLFSGIQDIPKLSMSTEVIAQAKPEQGIQLSHKGHFYKDTILISITTSNPKDIIYYTLDGSQPKITSDRYSKPIEIKAEEGVTTKVLRAIAISGSTEGAAITHTYFVGKDVNTRFSTMVVSLSTDPVNLYDYETGIFVEGKLRQDYILANPNEEIQHYHPANYNQRGREYERPVYVEMFDTVGERVINQKAGMRTHGGWARSLEQKSIRLIARNEYESGKGKFDYDFFSDDNKFDAYNSPVKSYDSLVLRGISNYYGTPMLNNEVASRLARDAGFHEALFFRPVAVFLNGEYYGFSFMEQLINEQTLQEAYEAPELAFDIAGVGETRLDEATPEVQADLEALNAYANRDLNNDQIYQELSKRLDIDNFLQYYAIQLYLGNSDWPHNNLKRWRYSGDTKAPNLHPYLDGRWRYILYDLDRTFGFMPDEQPTLDRLLGEGENNSPMLKAMLKRPEVAQRFLAILSELANGAMASDNVEEVLNSIYAQTKQEVQLAYEADKFSSALVKDEGILSYSDEKGKRILTQVKRALGYKETFELIIEGKGKYIYPLGSTVSIKPKLSRYEAFDGWLVNGVPKEREQLTITKDDVQNGKVQLTQLSHLELPALQLVEVSQDKNRIILRNNTDSVISTKGYYLSDNTSDLTLWAFTPMRIKPDETVVIVGKTITSNTVLFVPQLNFNVKQKEVIILSDQFGQVLDYKIAE